MNRFCFVFCSPLIKKDRKQMLLPQILFLKTSNFLAENWENIPIIAPCTFRGILPRK